MTVDTGFRPIKVATIDVEHCPDTISGHTEYAALWALVRERGRPRGAIQVPFPDRAISVEDLHDAIAQLPAVAASGEPALTADADLPSITVVIPSMLERLEGLGECLQSLAACDYPGLEVIVVDNRPAGAPVQPISGALVVRQTSPGISAARNAGLRAAHGEIIAFTDDDVVVDPGWLRAIAMRLVDHPEEAGVTGLALPRQLATPAQVGLEQYYGGFGPRTYEPVSHRMRSPRGVGPLLGDAAVDALGDDGAVRRSFSLYAAGAFGPGANMAFRAARLREVGGFDEDLGAGSPCRGGEDLVMFARLVWRGHALGFEPAAVVHHTHRATVAELHRQIYGYGLGFGALVTALAVEDRRHLGRILATAGRAIRLTIAGYRSRAGQRGEGGISKAGETVHNRDLARAEMRGMALGPFVYLRARLRRRR